MIDQLTSRAQILLSQKRYTEAGRLLTDVLGQEPANVYALGLLAEVRLQQDRNEEAMQLAERAIGLQPDLAYLVYIRARIHLNSGRYDAAEEDLAAAMQLDPSDADYHALAASVKLDRKQPEKALELADRALAFDPENILALNTRSSALLKLNRRAEAELTIEGALREDPENPYTHATYGWNLLEKGEHRKALEHFREALRIAPGFAYARSGMTEALKAHNLLYRLFLKYVFWMSSLSEKYQWGVIVGFYALTRFSRSLAASNEALRPFLMPVYVILTCIALSTWLISPLSNLFLLLNRYGRHLLSKEEKMSSWFVAGFTVLALASLLVYMMAGDVIWLAIAAYGLCMTLPSGSLFMKTRVKYAMFYYTAAMFITGCLSLLTIYRTQELFNLFTSVFLLGFIGFQWAANFMHIKQASK